MRGRVFPLEKCRKGRRWSQPSLYSSKQAKRKVASETNPNLLKVKC